MKMLQGRKRKYRIVIIFLVIISTFSIHLFSQDKINGKFDDNIKKFEIMSPLHDKQPNDINRNFLILLEKQKTSEKLAIFYKNFYDALIANGFSKPEALKIITSIGFPKIQ